MLASDLDEEDASIHPLLAPAPARVVAAASPDRPFHRDRMPQTWPLPAPPSAVTSTTISRPDLWPEPEVEPAPNAWRRFARAAAIGAAMVVCALVLTKGLAEMVWEFVGR